VPKLNRSISFCFVVCLVLFSCHRTERITLGVDFSKAPLWRYMLGIDITGNLQEGTYSHDFTSSLRTYLKGELSPHDSNSVHFKTSQTIITSNFIDEQTRLNLTRQLENNTLFFSSRDGAFDAADTSVQPLINVGGWNLFRSFARVVPLLPENPVHVGSTWDRERTFPLETDHGNAVGWLYQSFTLDSIAKVESAQCAFISWTFSYRIQPDKSDTATMLDTLPLKGSGNGTALIDCTNKVLIKAHAVFEVPPVTALPSAAQLKASWHESVHFELVN
jgi:hypothetical protein